MSGNLTEESLEQKIVEIYKTAYAYLQDTYYEIDDKIAYAETVKSYIVNFYNIFKEKKSNMKFFGTKVKRKVSKILGK